MYDADGESFLEAIKGQLKFKDSYRSIISIHKFHNIR